jgi:prepilin-type N-terminal cleavage/methylation domain-containing protein
MLMTYWCFPGKGERKCRGHLNAFTLIELLIVIAIILILIAIALPNFLESRVRALVTKIRAEHRSLYTAIESYNLIYHNYPVTYHERINLWKEPANTDNCTVRWGLRSLTTPIAFIKPLPNASFTTLGSRGWGAYNAKPNSGSAYEKGVLTGLTDIGWRHSSVYDLRDTGPDQVFNNEPKIRQYSPTNGTLSAGDIILFGP